MENEPPSAFAGDEGRASTNTKRGRIMGKLFGRERKVSNPEASNDLNAFLHGTPDKLDVEHATLSQLTRLDTTSAPRYPNALNVQNAPMPHRSLSLRQPPRRTRNKAGLLVRFADTFPEIIGQGGDECDTPTVAISKQKKSRPPPVTTATAPAAAPAKAPAISVDVLDRFPRGSSDALPKDGDSRASTPLRRMPTVHSSVSPAFPQLEIPAGTNTSARYLSTPVTPQDEKRKSIIEIQQAAMREAEGAAFANAVRSATSPHAPPHAWDERNTSPPGLEASSVPDPPEVKYHPPPIQVQVQVPPTLQGPATSSPSSTHPLPPAPLLPPLGEPAESPLSKLKKVVQGLSQNTSPSSSQSSFFNNRPSDVPRTGSKMSQLEDGSPSSTHGSTSNLSEVVVAAVADDAMDLFVVRTRHLFELFRLHSESVRPLVGCDSEELVRASLWWFLKGRMALEKAVRERPADAESQTRNEHVRQQSYADLAKAYWLSEEILPDMVERKNLQTSQEVEDARKALSSNLRKLAVSMKRNGFLPPEEALLPAHLERSIWLEYPHLTQDVIALLWGTSVSYMTQSPRPTSGMALLETLPLGDTSQLFCFGRVHADVFLMEQGLESQIYFSCLLSITRPSTQVDLSFVIASQNGSVQLRMSGNKKLGPVWDDVRWRPDSCTLDIKLPRGFLLVIRCSQQDYRMLWSMYEFSAKVQSSLSPRQDELCIFRSNLRSFQYFDNDPQARQFPRDSVADCEIALHERILRKGEATGPRCFHRGYRISVVTGPRTKTLSGVNQPYTPQMPVLFGFLVGENHSPALSIGFENGKIKGSMVMTFKDKDERLQLHNLLVGISLQKDESVYADVALTGFWMSERFGESNKKPLTALSTLPWQKAKVLNVDNGGDRPDCVLADKLRVIFEHKDGTMTDRVNVAPGELKLRLDVQNPSCLMVFRQPQNDLTIAIAENTPSSREKSQAFALALDIVQRSPTIRTYMFPSVDVLHKFETALTGFSILYDGIAGAFAIARRRMVVPIHKKWEAGATRLQVVQQDGVMQLLAFFEDFAHGQCMGFTLKGTDVFETFTRGSKFGLKLDDAKFPLPKVVTNEEDAQAAADAAFVCLDLPELPGEHDDISILFDSDAERQRLIACLPAPVKGSRYSRNK